MIHVEAQGDAALAELIREAAQAVIEHQSASGKAHLSIVVADDARLQQLNRDFRGIDSATDVLAFPASETDPQTGALYLGDVVISAPRAAEQAVSAGHPVATEVQLLTVHGILHLLGHDHAGAEDKARMWRAQAEILERLGLGESVISE